MTDHDLTEVELIVERRVLRHEDEAAKVSALGSFVMAVLFVIVLFIARSQ